LMLCGQYDFYGDILGPIKPDDAKRDIVSDVIVDWKSASAVREKHKYQAAFYAKKKGAKKSMVVALGGPNKCGYSVYEMDETEINGRYEVLRCMKLGLPIPPTKKPITPKVHG